MKAARSPCMLLGALFVAACGASTAPSPALQQLDATPTAPVEEHAVRGAAIREAVERGDLNEAKVAANALVAYVTKYEKPAPESRLEAMVMATRQVANAKDMPDAARSFAMLSERCGECHTAIGGPASAPAKPPSDTLGVVPRMRRHHWAAARLWEGLVAPSDEAWKSGAQVLSEAPLKPETVPGKTSVPEIDKLAASVHDLGVQATTATKASARVEVYGELLTTCGACHQRTSRSKP